jgi:hypothetical protein
VNYLGWFRAALQNEIQDFSMAWEVKRCPINGFQHGLTKDRVDLA